jgi:predicted HicB family RNase H-like nuclease
MKKQMEYKGYTGSIEYSKEDKVFYGKILDIRGLITFESDTLDGLPAAFHDSVDDYLKDCEEEGWEPLKPVFEKAKKRIDKRSSPGSSRARA